MISIIELVLTLLQSVLAAAGVDPKYASLVTGVQAAIAALEKVRNTPITFSQLEGLRIKPTWPTPPA